MRIGICEWTTFPASFEDELVAYHAAGAGAIGILEPKLEGVDDVRGKLRESSLAVSACLPAAGSILPSPLIPGPEEPEARVESICASVARFAELEPGCVFFLTGPGDDRGSVVEGIRRIADAGARHGVPVALEPIQREFAEFWSIVGSLDEAAALIDESGADVGLLYDSWHLWREPLEQVERHRDRIRGVHLADWREPTRNTNDRVLPGDGVVEFGPILAALDWDGFYDLEIFSDAELEGSLWREEPRELARRGLDALRRTASTASA